MTIKRLHYDGPIDFICDECGCVDETFCSDFPSAMAKFRSHGGRAVKVDEEWQHECADCREESP